LPDAPTWITPDVRAGPKAPALIVGGLAFVVGGYAPDVYALDPATGTVLWNTGLAGSAPPSFGDDQVYFGDVGATVSAVGNGPPPPPPKLTASTIHLTPALPGKPLTASIVVRSGGMPVKGRVNCAGKLAGKALRGDAEIEHRGLESGLYVDPSCRRARQARSGVDHRYPRRVEGEPRVLEGSEVGKSPLATPSEPARPPPGSKTVSRS
jgi:hypothetical protein